MNEKEKEIDKQIQKLKDIKTVMQRKKAKIAFCETLQEQEIRIEECKSERLLVYPYDFSKEDIPSPQSIKYSNEVPGGFSKSKGEQITSNMLRRELLTKRLELFNMELDKFMPLIYLLNTRHRNIIRTYVCSRGYSEMIRTLDESYCISVSTYKREFPKACLELAKYIDLNNKPSLEKLEKELYKDIKREKE